MDFGENSKKVLTSVRMYSILLLKIIICNFEQKQTFSKKVPRMSTYFRNYVQIDLKKVRENCKIVRTLLNDRCKLMVVLKANAYGHGIEQCAVACEDADMFAVATVEEALQIRRVNIQTPVLILGPIDPSEIDTICQNRLTLTIGGISYAEQIQQACARSGQQVSCHIKMDTGLNRTGIRCRCDTVEEACEAASKIFAMPALKIEGVYTHFACAGSEDPDDQAFTKAQYDAFLRFCKTMQQRGFSLGLRHCCSTSGIVCHPEMEMDMVRTGMMVLGQCTCDAQRIRLQLEPALCWRARVLQLREVPEGESVSYDRLYRTTAPTKIAIIAAGYADGYNQTYSNRSRLLLHGTYAPVIGKICMDYLMADVSAVPDVKEGDYAVLLGMEGGKEVSAMELGTVGQIAPGAVTCAITSRVPRIYYPENPRLLEIEDPI